MSLPWVFHDTPTERPWDHDARTGFHGGDSRGSTMGLAWSFRGNPMRRPWEPPMNFRWDRSASMALPWDSRGYPARLASGSHDISNNDGTRCP